MIIYIVPTTRYGRIFEERRVTLLILPIRTCIECYRCEAVFAVVGNFFVTHSHQHDDVIIPCTFLCQLGICALPCPYSSLWI